ncbi:hypothetical protein MJI95_37205, partial [Salmonella enterica subsp. enterica serovar Kentucky]|nr:hypothetical protein [Salmonella enterica subsp. enterica serovar Kentucky]
RIIEKLIENDIELALPSLVVRAPVQVEETRDYSNTADAKNADIPVSFLWAPNIHITSDYAHSFQR